MPASDASTDPSRDPPADVSRDETNRRASKQGPWLVFLSHTSELSVHPNRNPGERSYIDRVKEAVATAKHVPQQMDQFPAVDEPPSTYDVRSVRDCDVYVGIHGLRWGSPVRNQPEMSYTEQEYDTATAAGIPRLLFLLDYNS